MYIRCPAFCSNKLKHIFYNKQAFCTLQQAKVLHT